MRYLMSYMHGNQCVEGREIKLKRWKWRAYEDLEEISKIVAAGKDNEAEKLGH